MKQYELKAILKEHELWLQSRGKRADLRKADLRKADLRGADLRKADLRGAYLQGAYLQGANLRRAHLQDAHLQGAFLTSAYLQGANLTSAYLQGANLTAAHLQGAKFATNFKKVGWFKRASFFENQIPWVYLHPKFSECESTLKWVKTKSKQVAGSSEQAILYASGGGAAVASR